MAEIFMRCRLYPACRIHIGATRPTSYTAENRAEMRALHQIGWPVEDIAKAFDARPQTVTAILMKGKK